MKQLQLFYKEERRFFFSLFLLMLVQSFGTLLLPYFLAKIIDEGILKVDTTAIWHNGWWMFAIAIGTVIVSVGGSYLSAHLSGKFGHFLRMRLFKKHKNSLYPPLMAMVRPLCWHVPPATSTTSNKF